MLILKKDDSSECKLKNFFFANNSDLYEKWLIFESNMNIKNEAYSLVLKENVQCIKRKLLKNVFL